MEPCSDPDPCPDNDGDGVRSCAGDCNDDPNNGGRNVNPSAFENCTDGIDNDCDGDPDGRDRDCQSCSDGDGDGYTNCQENCDGDRYSNPGILEAVVVGNCSDGVDNDCDGEPDERDSSCTTPPPCIPAIEVCDGEDNDCDGVIDEGCGGGGGGGGGPCTPYYWETQWYWCDGYTFDDSCVFSYVEYTYAGCW